MTTVADLRNVEDAYPLTPMQQGMLYHVLSEPESAVFFNQRVVTVEGSLDEARFKAAWERMVDRHAALRTAFIWDGLDEPLQVVRSDAELAWTMDDWSDLTDDQASERLEELLRQDAARGFDLAEAPLMRMHLIARREHQWTWVWSCHHLIADGWSVAVLMRELEEVYASLIEDRELDLPEPYRYRDLVASWAARDAESDARYWKQRLDGFGQPHRLNVPGLEPPHDAEGHEWTETSLPQEATAALLATCASQRVTLSTAVQAAWALVLARWTGESDVVFGVTSAGRDLALDGADGAVGLFINTLPTRITVAPDRTVSGLLGDVQRDAVEAFGHERTSLADVQRWSGVAPGDALFESIVVIENLPEHAKDPDGKPVRFRVDDFVEHSNYALAVLALPGDELALRLVFDRARFHPDAVASLGNQLAEVLSQFGASVDVPVRAVRSVPDELADDVRAFEAGPGLEDVGETIVATVERHARDHPDRLAVVTPDERVSYRQVVDRADALADCLRAAGVGTNTLVGLHVPRSADMIVGLLGIQLAGAAYVPLDPAYPAEHLAVLLENASIEYVVTNESLRDVLATDAMVITVDADLAEHEDQGGAEGRALTSGPALDDLAYVIHTSGSTGTPKAVGVSHRNLAQSTSARGIHYGGPADRFLLMSSFSFDSSIVGIFWTLASGGTLVLPESGAEHDMDRLRQMIRGEGVTHLLALPTLYELLLEGTGTDDLASLGVAIVAGEACPATVQTAHERHVPHAELHNEYGPTEATVWCTAHRATGADAGTPMPIGRPIAGARVYVLDQHGNRVPPGFAGELCVAGQGVTGGYLGRPDLTAEKFVTIAPDGTDERVYTTGDLATYRPDGVLHFLGRVDHQLKIRGHRIEPGAVESALRRVAGVRDAAASGYTPPGRSSARLVAYVTIEGDASPSMAEIVSALGETLPPHMVPDTIVTLDSIPRLANGKVDHAALPPPTDGDDSATAVPPRNPTESELARIWGELLGHPEVGVHDDFFALGGDSIVSIQMVSRARQAGIRVQPADVARFPTIAGLGAIAEPEAASLPAARVTGPVPLAPIQEWFFGEAFERPEHWNQSARFEVPSGITLEHLRAALDAVVDHHDMLRARYELADGAWKQIVDDERTVDVVELGDGDELQDLEASLDLASGRLIAAAVVRQPEGATDLLAIAVHHLVMDVVSWNVLLDDLALAYRRVRGGEPVRLPDRTVSYADWVDRIESADRSQELEYWLSVAEALPVPVDHETGTRGTEATTTTVTASLPGAATEALVGRANDTYGTRTEDLVVAAVVEALSAWTGASSVTLQLEGHGRDEGLDLSRTIGWFTSSFPVAFERSSMPGGFVKGTKEALRSVPSGGSGFGALAFVDRDRAIVARRRPDVLFNYLGRALTPDGELFAWIPSDAGRSRDLANQRPYLLEVIAMIAGDRLAIEWQYSSEVHDRDTIQQLADASIASLERLIVHCVEAEAAYTPSDFPEVDLDQDELDDFLGALE